MLKLTLGDNMKKTLIMFILVLLISSCSTSYSGIEEANSDNNIQSNEKAELRFLRPNYKDLSYKVELNFNLPPITLGNSITVKFDTNGGSNNPPDQILSDGKSIVVPQIPRKEGYIFKGWVNSQTNIYYNFSNDLSSNLNLVAEWERLNIPKFYFTPSYQIINTISLNQKISINFDENIKKAIAIYSPIDAYVRIYSTNTKNTAIERADPEFTILAMNELMYNREFKPVIDFERNDIDKSKGLFDYEINLTLKKGLFYFISTYAYRLDKNKSGTTDIVVEYMNQVSNDNTGKAVLSNIPSEEEISIQEVNFDNPAKNWIPDPEIRNGMYFSGWFLDKEGKGEAYDLSTPLNNDIKLYAKWSKTYIDYKQSSGGMPNVWTTYPVYLSSLSNFNLDLFDPYGLKDNPDFLGWYDGPDINSNLKIDKNNNQLRTEDISKVYYLYPAFKDKVSPTIELTGDSIIYLRKNEEFIEPGYVARDNIPGEIEVVKNGEVDVSKDGEYIIKYFSIDKSGNKSVELERKIIVWSQTPDLAFKFDFLTGMILNYDTEFGDSVVIPSSIAGVEVISIGEEAFYKKNIKSVVIPNSVKTIGKSAFRENLLSEVSIPDSVENIGLYAFASNPIEKLKLGSGLIRIEDSAFQAEYSSEGYKSKLKSVTIPSNVQVIRTYAFLGVALESIIIEGEISRFNKFWRYTGFPKNLMPGFTTNNGYDFDKIFGEIIAYDVNFGVNLIIPETIDGVAVKSIGTSAFFGKGIETLVLPETLELIGKNSFTRNFIKELIIPNNVITIDENAFAFNPIEKLSLGSGIKTIEEFAFQGPPTSLLEEKLYFSKLYDLVIPSQLLKLGYLSFSNNPLKSVTIEGNEKRFNNQWTNYGFPARLMP